MNRRPSIRCFLGLHKWDTTLYADYRAGRSAHRVCGRCGRKEVCEFGDWEEVPP